MSVQTSLLRALLWPQSDSFRLDPLHIRIRKAEMMPDLVHQNVRDEGAQRLLVLGPVVEQGAAGLSWYFLGETLDTQGGIGGGLILLAVLVGAFGNGPQSSLPPVGKAQPA